MQGVKSNRYKYLILFPFDIIITSIGIVIFKVFNKNYNFFYQSMVRLFCVLGGKGLTFINFFVSKKGKLNLTQEKFTNLDNIVNEVKKNGFYIYENYLSEKNCENILEYCLKSELYHRPLDHENWGDEKKYSIFEPKNPKAVWYEMPYNNVLKNKIVSKIIFSKEILLICEKYLKCKPIFYHAGLTITSNFFSIPSDKAAQMYHFDLETPKFLKIFVYINDVTTENGPHFYVIGTHKDNGIDKSILSLGYSRAPDEMVNNKYKEITKHVGKRGTLIVEDTIGLHKGTVIKKKNDYRCLLCIEFSSTNYGTAEITTQDIPKENIDLEVFNKNPCTYQNLKIIS